MRHFTVEKLNKAEELTYLSTNIVVILYLKIFLIRYVACLFIVK